MPIPLVNIMDYITRKARLDDLPTLLEFEQGVINVERPMDPTIKEGNINYYDISELITSNESDVFVVEMDNKIVASGYAKIKDDRFDKTPNTVPANDDIKTTKSTAVGPKYKPIKAINFTSPMPITS